jgi:putative membrane protein
MVPMSVIATVAVLLIAALHAYILVLEMFLWTGPRARGAFGTTAEFAAATKALAANQGLYNGFLAAGLVWGAVASDPVGFQARVFFLVCVAVAGVYGAATASRKILFVQTVPALVALALVLAAH